MAELKELIFQRGKIKSSVTRFGTYLKKAGTGSTKTDQLILQARLTDFKGTLNLYTQVHNQIEYSDSKNAEQHAQDMLQFEDEYYALVAEAQEILLSNSKQNATPDQSNSNQQIADITNAQIKLPSIDLPMFNGQYDQWLTYKDLFTSIIGTNQSLSNVQKFHYLRASLKNDAAELITSLDLSSDNYSVAWKLLEERYENTKLIVHNHVKALFELPVVYKENHSALRQLLDTLSKHLRALRSLDQPTDSWSTLLIYLLSTKLDTSTLRDWESHSATQKELPSMDDMISFLHRKCQILETVTRKTCKQPETVQLNYKKPLHSQPKKQYASHVATSTVECYLCKNPHMLYFCEQFLGLPQEKRFEEVKRLNLCINCLSDNHRAGACRSRRCRKCGKLHHSLLHINKSNYSANKGVVAITSEPSNTEPLSNGPELSAAVPVVATHHSYLKMANILLSTALIETSNNSGETRLIRALLDSGSQSNFITKEACEVLGLKTTNVDISIAGVNSCQSQISKAVELTIKSRINSFKSTLTFLVLPKITENLPIINVNSSKLKIPTTIALADPEFHRSSKIDMLLGAELFFDALCVGQFKLNQGAPTMQKTKFGWIVSGKIPPNPITCANLSVCHLTLNDLNNHLKRFWEIEEIQGQCLYTQEETQCELHFKNNHQRRFDGRFEVQLPFKNNLHQLGESRNMAMKRFTLLEKRLLKNPVLRTQYNEFMQEYLHLGHMTISTKKLSSTDNYFLPHHAVIKEDSLTTKLRVVFDGSAKTSSGISLNETLMKGPTIQEELVGLLLRFRIHNYVMTADIEKMYRQVQIKEEDTKYQQILWRFSENEPIQAYTLNTVTYGTTSAPFLAVRCLLQLAQDEEELYPLAAAVLKQDFYVDDLISGSKTISEAIELRNQLNELLGKGKFKLRKWRSNDSQIIQAVPQTDTDHSIRSLENNDTMRTLGLLWKPTTDTLAYSVSEIAKGAVITKRTILARIAQIFDPLGLIGPVITTAKLTLQRLWELNLNWDESVLLSIHSQWIHFQENLEELNKLRIPRQAVPFKSYEKMQLHGFCDASELAYGACIYIRVTDQYGNHAARLLCSKSRIAPLKRITIPRLELCAALLLSNLASRVQEAVRIPFDSRHFWTDSTIVLAWLAAPARTWQTFVANRVAKIQESSPGISWRHVNTKDNPADPLSRGMIPETLLNNELWWTGPHWLGGDCNLWPEEQPKPTNDTIVLQEKRRIALPLTTNQGMSDMFTKYSSMKTLQRIIAYVLRFINNTLHRGTRNTGPLTVTELYNSLMCLTKCTQLQSFEQEVYDLGRKRSVKGQSKLVSLNPFLDKRGIIRVGGRIRNSELNYDRRHPMLLPATHPITNLLIRDEHIKLLHAGPQSVLASIRRQFWPLAGRNAVRGVIRKCVTCFKNRPKSQDTFMGDLPKNRILPSRPFSNCGVDYGGPLMIRESKSRGRIKSRKCYVAVFVCFATKAVHIEPVTDLTTEAFLGALRRFISRRGNCKNIYSDNGTNFVGARNHLRELNEFLTQETSDRLNTGLSNSGVTWHFIPARSPHFGGLWEASVKSLKHHLHRVAGTALLTFEELYTLLTQIEAILNSRPITPLSNDPHDLAPLTPAHFLIGDTLTSPPEENLDDLSVNRLSRWQHIQKMKGHFWKRWSTEYLAQLQQRTKWSQKTTDNIQMDSMVLVREENLPPLRWRIGRICELHPGDDGIVRVVSVKTASGVSKMSVRRVCVLPLSE